MFIRAQVLGFTWDVKAWLLDEVRLAVIVEISGFGVGVGVGFGVGIAVGLGDGVFVGAGVFVGTGVSVSRAPWSHQCKL